MPLDRNIGQFLIAVDATEVVARFGNYPAGHGDAAPDNVEAGALRRDSPGSVRLHRELFRRWVGRQTSAVPFRPQDDRSGAHSDGVPAGIELIGRSVLNVAPTILAAAGVRPPKELDGKPPQVERVMAV